MNIINKIKNKLHQINLIQNHTEWLQYTITKSQNSDGKSFFDNNLVFDFGVNDGSDSGFYLAKGFRVVGIEANPDLADAAAIKFSSEIEAGQYTLLNYGVWDKHTVLPFYKNLDNDHWSSFDKNYGARENTRHEIIEIQCILPSDIYLSFGAPRYMKIDIEGADRIILRDLSTRLIKPLFISVEEYGLDTIKDLRLAGYRSYFIAPQNDKSWCSSNDNDLEGIHVDWVFNGTNTGIFGKDIQIDWMSYDEAFEYFRSSIRNERGEFLGPAGEWYDVHARLY